MPEYGRLLLFPLIAVAAWFLSRHRSETTRKAVRVMTMFATFLFLTVVCSGLAKRPVGGIDIHRWSGHYLVIAAWLLVPFSIGVACQRSMPGKKGVAVAQSTLLLLLLGFMFLSSFTGYLGPSHVEQQSEETDNRFTMLHLFVLPSLVAMLLIVWYWLFRPTQPR